MKAISLATLTDYLNDTLTIASFSDVSNNGLQIANCGTVSHVAFGVDASLAFMEAAVAEGADAVVCHHGLSWGNSLARITGVNYTLVHYAITHNLAVYGIHLPLDAHRTFGNNAQLAMVLGLRGVRQAFAYHGETIGCCGTLARGVARDAFLERVRCVVNPRAELLANGPEIIKKVGIVSGGAGDMVEAALALGCDVLLTGEGAWQDRTLAENARANVIYAGHYETEIFGVRALSQAVARTLALPTTLINFHPCA